jgi:hypothetical protein
LNGTSRAGSSGTLYLSTSPPRIPLPEFDLVLSDASAVRANTHGG